MEVYTTGFTKKTAAEFFGSVRQAGIKRLIDVRLHNSSQLAGFTKREDLPFFLREICQAQYLHEPLLAPAQAILDAYKQQMQRGYSRALPSAPCPGIPSRYMGRPHNRTPVRGG